MFLKIVESSCLPHHDFAFRNVCFSLIETSLTGPSLHRAQGRRTFVGITCVCNAQTATFYFSVYVQLRVR